MTHFSPLRALLPTLLLALLAACGGSGSNADAGSGSSGGETPPPGSSTASVSLAWNAPTDSRIVGFRVYYGTSSRNYVQAKGSGLSTNGASSYTVTNLVPGQTYYFAVTSYDGSANESDFSAEVAKQVN